MNDRQRLIDEVLDEALESDPSGWDTILDRKCQGDAALRESVAALLLSHQRSADFLEPPIDAALVDFLSELGESVRVGDQVGLYSLREVIATGGMGTVYKATRTDDTDSTPVAVKLIRRGMDTDDLVRRFQLERQTLASLRHPNIAPFIDGGTTPSGQPYLVMEYVPGQPIDRYCDRHCLSITERLGLMRTVCAAVQYAHQNLIIHRDIKPGNILVTDDGIVKLLDFGVSKLIPADATHVTSTLTNLRMVTPQYMSPDILRGAAPSTAMDVYSLGLVLYELLTGHRVFDIHDTTPDGLRRVICDTDPLLPSTVVMQTKETRSTNGRTRTLTPDSVSAERSTKPTELRRALRGDLDLIVMTALHKDPVRRYGSVEQFSLDVDRYLNGFPVTARKDSVGYRIGMFLRRHRVGTTAAGLVLLSLLLGIAGTTYGLISARRQTQLARVEAIKTDSIKSFLQEMLSSVDPELGQPDMRVRDVLDRAAVRIQSDAAMTPAVRAELRHTIGEAYLSLGLHELAEPHLRAALEQRKTNAKTDGPEIVRIQVGLGRALRAAGNYAEAESYLNNARSTLSAMDGNHDELIVRVIDALAEIAQEQGDLTKTESLLREALIMQRRASGPVSADTAHIMERLGVALASQGRMEEAESLCRESLAINRKLYDEPHVRVSHSRRRLAIVLHQMQELNEAESLYRAALATDRALLGEEHPNVSRILNNLGPLLVAKGDREQAVKVLQEALVLRRKIFGNQHVTVAVTLNNLATAMDAESAEPLLRESLAISRSVFGDDYMQVGRALSNLGASLKSRGKYADAEPLYQEAIAIARKNYPMGHLAISYPLLGLGDVRLQRGDAAGAESLLREAVAIRQQHLPPEHRATVAAESALATCLTKLQQ